MKWHPQLQSRFTANVQKSLIVAANYAIRDKSSVLLVHLLSGIVSVKDSLANQLIESMNIKASDLLKIITGGEVLLKIEDLSTSPLKVSKQVRESLFEAIRIAKEVKAFYVGTEHILLAILRNTSKEGGFIKTLSLHSPETQNMLLEALKSASLPFDVLKQVQQSIGNASKPLPLLPQESGESAINLFTENVIRPVNSVEVRGVDQRKGTTDKILQVLLRSRNKNVFLLGASGVGKTFVMEELANRLAVEDVPSALIGKKIRRINFAAIVALSKFPNEIEKQVMAILNEAYGNPNIILYIDDLGIFLQSPARGGLGMGAAFKSFLEHGQLSMIVAGTPEDYQLLYENGRSLIRFFSIIDVEEPNDGDLDKIMKTVVKDIETKQKVKILPEALALAIRLSTQYITDRYLPEKAIEILDIATSKKCFENSKKPKIIKQYSKHVKELEIEREKLISAENFTEANKVTALLTLKRKMLDEMEKNHNTTIVQITEEDIKETISKVTKLPVATISSDETSMLLKLEDKIKDVIISQEEAINQVAHAVKRGRIGISNRRRPWASLLFLGPTGVGKTELGKVLARNLFGDDTERLIQIDMSEYMEQHSVSKLIGSPPGYVGFEQGGWLTEKIAENPFSVVLFDEIEKAHPDVLNLLLQILEDGHLMDAKGNRVSFQNTIVILTSNIGVDKITEDRVLGFYRDERKVLQEETNEAYDEMQEKLLRELRKKLRPELINRIDEIVIFKSLTKTDAGKILDILLADLNKRLEEISISFTITADAKKRLLEKGFSHEYGARPLRRVVMQEVENTIADHILEKNLLKKGGGKLEVGVKGKSIAILN